MKILVCGDRHWINYDVILDKLRAYTQPVTVIEGNCQGADKLAGAAAVELGFDLITIPADWKKYGRAAGPIRNIQMLELKPDLVMAFHADLTRSRGTVHTVREAQKRGIKVEVYPSSLK